jgi:hypothetical protein
MLMIRRARLTASGMALPRSRNLPVGVDRPGKRYEIGIDEPIAAAGFYDLAKINVRLTPGAIYDASIGGHKMTFQIDAKAKSGPAPIVSRLVRFQ